ncbi:MAG: M14-type cytosolic carboxypeptidase [Burkholderiaceae bacterium]|jgi:murein tripeptide amidase MpaA|nr:M14-type cytosolic carboxypeptidase [Burkholderiaceae bacterium]MDH5209672.1 M14-type cytosolic carboxypeptidase [Burkholderiaceae bacterium]
MAIEISSAFDSGAIEVKAVDGERADLAIRHDLAADGTRSEFLQWFHFRVSGAERGGASLRIVNAGRTTYAAGWRDYRAVASWDRRRWERVPTAYDGEVMTIELPPAPAPTYVAYFEPYSWERHLALLADSCARGATLRRLGSSVQGRDLDALVAGEGAHPVWIIGRQHPGETMAEWFIEGLLARLLDDADPLARALRAAATFHIVPNMNPDGSVLGNLRTNAAGANLNREWLAPTAERSPEVKAVRDAIHASGCAAFFDIHGDEALPYVFVAGCEMLPDFSDSQRDAQDRFAADFRAASPDFQSEHGYSASKYKEDVLKLASKYVGHEFGCLSLTLEMPFKDNANAPDPRVGWSAARSARLGAAMLDPLLRHLQRT